MKIQIEKMGINGEGIGYYRNKPVFIAGCFPGETVEWKIREDRRSYYIGSLIRIEKRSRQRRKEFCPHNRLCGSCPLMTLQYEAQLENKRELLKEAFFKYAHQEINPDMTVASPRQTAYRNKCALPVVEAEGRLVNAMYQSGSNKPVNIDRCPLHEEKLEEIRLEILKILNKHHLKAYDHKQKKGIRHLMVRGFGEQYQAVIVTGEEKLPRKLIDDLMADDRIVSLYQIVNTVRNPVSLLSGKAVLLAGKNNIDLNIEERKFSLAPQSFFQLNTQQALNIYRKVRELLGEDCGTVVEAFCGIGVMSLMLAEKCEKIIGIDLEKSAVENARENARVNNIKNAEFICADANEQIGKIARKQIIDVMIVDPPRTGLGADFIETIVKSKPRKIIYVSCNPATLARNYADLARYYELTFIQPYDMFPQTPHVETVTLWNLRK
ncbi:MAG: 23S rRNA (uracil(1939)-C(5))-methyltransferase RlmD [Erysipelotrichaceae bacterium]|nr:23S rRNA (uracil(1939)-C(5))-methyltransferase RlmD [Erysipelotrichaceae bacterium]